MTSTALPRELRLAAVLALILALYGAVVFSVAADFGQTEAIQLKDFSHSLQVIGTLGFGGVFIIYCLELMLVRRPARPLQVMATEFRAEVFPPDRMAARLTVLAAWMCTMALFTPFKRMLPYVNPFEHDTALMQLDRTLFLGTDPWVVTHALFGGPFASYVIQFMYNLWFFVMWLSIMYALLRPGDFATRARYVIAFPLCWIVVGSLSATLLSSVGPCYYERLLGDPHYAPLMQRLHMLDAQIRTVAPDLGLFALTVQDSLWAAYTAKTPIFGGGITAMPSMHCSIAILMACAAWRIGPKFGWVMTIYAVVIWVGSIHLGWHYALDGIVSLALTVPIWKASGLIVDRFVQHGVRRSTAPTAVLAE
jgi:hypothetical protein